MAPFCVQSSPEVDVFSVPHARMKQLVTDYSTKLENANFADCASMNQLLQCLQETFLEFKNHESIENKLIMSQLKQKLKQCKVHSTAVCNCHEDSHLNDMLKLVSDGYDKKSVIDRINYGRKLKAALVEFTKSFLPHMKEEEEIFQPLLLEHFSYEELCDLKKSVLQQHHLKLMEKSGCFEKEVDIEISLRDSVKSEIKSSPISNLPPEILMTVLSVLNVKDLMQCSQVCTNWNTIAFNSAFWKEIHPIQWSKGNWDYKYDGEKQYLDDLNEVSDLPSHRDDDADVDESLDSDSYKLVRKESKIINGLNRFVLPKIGQFVSTVNLAFGRSVSNNVVNKILRSCPNTALLDLSSTQITELAFKRYTKSGCTTSLKYLNLSGCSNISDSFFISLAMFKIKNCFINDTFRSNHSGENSPNDFHGLSKSSEYLESSYEVKCNNFIRNLDLISDFYSFERISSYNQMKQTISTYNKMQQTIVHKLQQISAKKSQLKFARNSQPRVLHTCIQTVTQNNCSNLTFNAEPFAATMNTSHLSQPPFNKECACDQKQCYCSNFSDNLNPKSPSLDKRQKTVYDFFGKLEGLNLSGCLNITDTGLKALMMCGPFYHLKSINFSGLCHITSETLHEFVNLCPKIDPESFYYCDNILDGPLADVANGCQTIDCPKRFCCRN